MIIYAKNNSFFFSLPFHLRNQLGFTNAKFKSIMAGYQISTPIDCEEALDASNLKGKTAIITGGKLTLVQDIDSI